MDPSRIGKAAGDLSPNTKIKVSVLAEDASIAPIKSASGKTKQNKTQGFILDVIKKAPAACAPPRSCNDPLRPLEEKFNRKIKRTGYKTAQSTWTWNECNEVSGLSPEFVNMHDPNVVLAGLSPMDIKMHTSVKGEKKYNVCGVQDMLPAAQERFTKADAPPSARHIYENNKRDLCPFERGVAGKSTGYVEFLAESPDMWNCMSGHERPLDTWRSMQSSRTPLYIRDEDDSRRDGRRSLLSSPTSSEFYDRTQPRDGRRPQTARSLLSSPTESALWQLDRERGSRTSRISASVTSSQLDLQQPRWR